MPPPSDVTVNTGARLEVADNPGESWVDTLEKAIPLLHKVLKDRHLESRDGTTMKMRVQQEVSSWIPITTELGPQVQDTDHDDLRHKCSKNAKRAVQDVMECKKIKIDYRKCS